MSFKDIRLIKPENLEQLLKKNKFPTYRSKQIQNWARKINVQSFNQMSNLPNDLIQFLTENFKLNKSKVKTSKKSFDGTIKFAIQLYDNLVVEAVLIPSNNRITACVSSQVGCSLDCNFCATSKIKKMRNLESYEIFDQIMLLNKESINHFSSAITNLSLIHI